MGGANQCCSSNDSADAAKGEIADAVSGAQVMAGNDPLGEAEAAPFQQQKDVGMASPACPGPDSAAGGDATTIEAKEHQYLTYDDGSSYTGQIVDGKRHGHGSWQSRTGQYEGQWQADAQHGQGRQTWSDGRVFDGQFQYGKFAGSGKMVWHTQKGLLVYDGEYKDDLKHGHGTFTWADGRTYDGEWQQGKRHGRGTYLNSRTERKTGYWLDDKFDRWEATGDEGSPPPQA